MGNFSVAPMSRKDIRGLVKEFREMFGLEQVLYFPIVQFIEWVLGRLGLELEIVSISDMPQAYGVTNPGTETMKIREDVYEGAIKGNPRDRLHYVMN